MCIKRVNLMEKDKAFCECCGKILTDYVFFVGSSESALSKATNKEIDNNGYYIKPHFYCSSCIQRKF